MSPLALAIVLFAACVSCYTEQEYQSTFLDWTRQYRKAYSTDEFQARYRIFKSNMDFVQQWNSGNSETEVGLNLFADLSNEEYRKLYLGTRVVVPTLPEKIAEVDTSTLPDSVDWRTKGAVTAVKDQGQCGSCWSFSTTGSVEGIHFLSTGNLVSLSEQNLMDCSTKYGNEGCNGGLMDDAFKYIIANKGVDTEASYPYEAKDGKCRFNAANVGATITGYTDVTSGSESDLQAASVLQPVSVAIDASKNSFQLYKSGIYYEPSCSTTQLDHGVLVVGYGTNGTSDYWLVKNSWAASWGLEGYIWMSRNRKNNCGIATSASYPQASGSTTQTIATSTTATSRTTTTHTATTHTATTHTDTATSKTTYGSLLETKNQAPKNAGGKGFTPQKDQADKFSF